MARRPKPGHEQGPKVWYPGLPDTSIDPKTKEQIKDAQGKTVYIHDPWPEGDYVRLRNRKSGFINSQATFQAQHIPDWATPDVIKSMSSEEFSKISWRSDIFNATVVFEMLDTTDPNEPCWLLHDADDGRLIEPPMTVEGLMQVFEDYEVEFLMAEINKLGRGPKAEVPMKDPLTGATFPVLGPDGSTGDGEEPGHGGDGSETLVG